MECTQVHSGEPPPDQDSGGCSCEQEEDDEELAGDPADKGEPPDGLNEMDVRTLPEKSHSDDHLIHSLLTDVDVIGLSTILSPISSTDEDSGNDNNDNDNDDEMQTSSNSLICVGIGSGSEKSEARIPSSLLSAASKSWSTIPTVSKKDDSISSMHRELECHEYIWQMCLNVLLDKLKSEKISAKKKSKLTRPVLCKLSTHMADSIVEYAKVKFASDFTHVLTHPSSKPSVCLRINQLIPRYLDDDCVNGNNTYYYPKDTSAMNDSNDTNSAIKSGEKNTVEHGPMFPCFPAGTRHFSPYTGATTSRSCSVVPRISTAALLNSPEYIPGQGMHASTAKAPNIPGAPFFRLNPDSPSLKPRMPEIKDRARVEKSKLKCIRSGSAMISGLSDGMGAKKEESERGLDDNLDAEWDEAMVMTDSEVHSGLIKVCRFVIAKMLPKADDKSRGILANIVADSIFSVCSADEKPWILAPHNRLKLVSEIKLSCGENYYSDEYLTLSLESLGLKDE